jgi:hypothetical protein
MQGAFVTKESLPASSYLHPLPLDDFQQGRHASVYVYQIDFDFCIQV